MNIQRRSSIGNLELFVTKFESKKNIDISVTNDEKHNLIMTRKCRSKKRSKNSLQKSKERTAAR